MSDPNAAANAPDISSASTQGMNAAQRLRDGVARSSGFHEVEYSGTAGAFVASLFALVLLAIMFIALSDHFQSYWKAGVVVGGGIAAWLLFAAFFRRTLGGSGTRRWVQAMLGVAIIAVVAIVIYYLLGAEIVKWFGIVVAGFYAIKMIVYGLERYCGSAIGKIAIWGALLVVALGIFYQVRF